MICLVDNKPVLLIGRHQLVGYDTDWLRTALEKAALDADFPEFPMMDFVVDAIDEYLENDCPLGALTIEELYSKIRKMLETTGCLSIANKLSPMSPSLKISLKDLANEAGGTYELGFFEAITKEIHDFKKFGVNEAQFIHTREAVQILTGAKRWNKRCNTLMDELKVCLAPYKLDFT